MYQDSLKPLIGVKPIITNIDELISAHYVALDTIPSPEFDAESRYLTLNNSLTTWMSEKLQLANLPKGSRIMDLGSGEGLPLLVFSLMGFKAYGVENDLNMVNYSRKIIDNVFKKFPEGHYLPEVIHASYFSNAFGKVKFQDSTEIKDIDLFHLFCYDNLFGNESHEEKVKRHIRRNSKNDSKFLAVDWDFGDPSITLEQLF